MFESLAKALAAGLSLWETKESRKYVDELMRIKKAYYAEDNKDPTVRSDAVLDNLMLELRVLADAFSAGVGKSNTADKP